MTKKIAIISIMLLSNILNAQVNALVKKFFFEFPSHSTLFDIRTKIHSSGNFSQIKEYSESINGEFNSHPFIINLPQSSSKPYLSAQFNSQGLSSVKTIHVYYNSNQVSECIQQYNELIKLFKPYSKRTYESSLNDSQTNEKVGIDTSIYPINGANFNILHVSYSFSKENNNYELRILLFEE